MMMRRAIMAAATWVASEVESSSKPSIRPMTADFGDAVMFGAQGFELGVEVAADFADVREQAWFV